MLTISGFLVCLKKHFFRFSSWLGSSSSTSSSPSTPSVTRTSSDSETKFRKTERYESRNLEINEMSNSNSHLRCPCKKLTHSIKFQNNKAIWTIFQKAMKIHRKCSNLCQTKLYQEPKPLKSFHDSLIHRDQYLFASHFLSNLTFVEVCLHSFDTLLH